GSSAYSSSSPIFLARLRDVLSPNKRLDFIQHISTPLPVIRTAYGSDEISDDEPPNSLPLDQQPHYQRTEEAALLEERMDALFGALRGASLLRTEEEFNRTVVVPAWELREDLLPYLEQINRIREQQPVYFEREFAGIAPVIQWLKHAI